MLVKLHNNSPVAALRNIGLKSAMMLAEAGIGNIGELREIGAVRAWIRARSLRPRAASLNLLWALAAGLEDRDWRDLGKLEKASLLAEVRRLRR